MSVLTNRTGTKITGQLLTNKRDVPFILGFRYPLEKKFTLTELEKRNNKELQGFLDKVSQMSVQQVDESFARKPDKDDTYRGLQVYHYEVTKSFRIHVVSEDGIYKIIRLDPNHRVHELKLEYSLKDMSKPIGVSAYQITSSLLEELERQLPSVEDIQKRIKGVKE